MITERLSPAEMSTLDAYELAIRQGLESFVEVGNALAKIRDGRLYRAEFDTFEAYCQTRWGLTRQYVNRLVAAAEVVDEMETKVSKPATVASASPLVKIPKEQRGEVWEAAVATAPKAKDGSPKVAAKHVEQAAKEASAKDAPQQEPASTRGKQERAAPVNESPVADDDEHEHAEAIALIERTDKRLAQVVYAWPEMPASARDAVMSVVATYQ